MKTLIALLLVLISSFSFIKTNAQIIPSDCSTNDTAVYNTYREDAAAMAFDRIRKLKTPDTANATINPLIIDSIHEALIAVYNAPGLPDSNPVKVMHTCNPSIHCFAIGVDSGNVWFINHWKQGNILTGDTAIDSLLIKYNVNKIYTPLYVLNPIVYITFITEIYINEPALTDSFK